MPSTTWLLIDSEPPPPPPPSPSPSVGGEGAADFSSRGNRSAESDDRRSVPECGGRRECNLYSVQQLAGYITILISCIFSQLLFFT